MNCIHTRATPLGELVRAREHARRGRLECDGGGVHGVNGVARRAALQPSRGRRPLAATGGLRRRRDRRRAREGEPWERVVDLRVEEGDGSLVECGASSTGQRATGARTTRDPQRRARRRTAFQRGTSASSPCSTQPARETWPRAGGCSRDRRGAADVARGFPAVRPASGDAPARRDPGSADRPVAQPKRLR